MISIDKLRKMSQQYQDKADYYYECYQMDGHARQLRAYERNNDLSEALASAANAKVIEADLVDLRYAVMSLRPDDERGDLALAVKRIQKAVAEGKAM